MVEEKTPPLVQLIAIVGFIGGLATLLFQSVLFQSLITTTAGILAVVFNLALIIGAYGLRVMKKWGLWLFSIALVYNLIVQFIHLNDYVKAGLSVSASVSALDVVLIALSVLILGYVVALRRKFN